MLRFARSAGLDWRFLLLVCFSTILTTLSMTGRFFPFGILVAIYILPVTLPGAVIGWCLAFCLAIRVMAHHHAAMVAAGTAGLAAVFSMLLFLMMFPLLNAPNSMTIPDFMGLLETNLHLSGAACFFGVVSAWFIYWPQAGDGR